MRETLHNWRALALACGLAGWSRTGDASACAPAVVITGDLVLVNQIAAVLKAHGLDPPRTGCPVEHVNLATIDGAIRVTIDDVDGRHVERTVADLATAAMLIESFSTSELPAPPHPRDPPIAAAMSTTRMVGDDEQPRILEPGSPPSMPRGAFGVGLETAFASDGSMWVGARARACMRIGPLCAGGEIRFARDAELGGDSERMESSRTSYDVLLGAELPFERGAWSFAPGIGVGVGWLNVRRDVTDPSGADTVEVDAGGIRTNAHFGASAQVARGVAMTLGLSFGFAPKAHSDPFIDEGRTVAGEPRAFGRIEIGLELGRR